MSSAVGQGAFRIGVFILLTSGVLLLFLERDTAEFVLMLPFTPAGILTDLADHKAAHPDFNIEAVHVFPLGGITKSAEFLNEFGQSAGQSAARA